MRGGKWYLEKRGSRKNLAGSRNLGSVFDKSRNLVFAWFVFTFLESLNFLPKSLRRGFLTRILASRQVSDFTIRNPFSGIYYCFLCNSPGLTDCTTAGKIVDVTDKVRVQGSTTATSKEETFR